MPFKCIPFESDDDFYDMMPALWEAFENPFNSFLRIVFYLGSTEERTQAIEAAADGTLSIHKATPGSNWLKVVDSTSGYLIGAANWILYESNPYDSPQEPIVAVWWPEGDGRDYATNYLQQVSAHKRRFFNRPHVYLNISFTLPKWRRQGAGSLLMEWGVKKADEMAVDSFIEASSDGKSLYETFGFLHFDTVFVDTVIDNPSEEWKKLEQELPPSPQYLMWRPVGGLFEPGKTTLPWGTKPFIPKSP